MIIRFWQRRKAVRARLTLHEKYTEKGNQMKNKPTILIVDDNPENLAVLGNIVTENGYIPGFATNGTMALASIKEEAPDLILLDVMMPDMDGFEVCRRLKQEATLADIPIIFLTAKTEKDDVIAGLKLGAVDYVTKPFNKKELLTRVETHLVLQTQKKQLQLQAEQLRQANEQLVQINQEKNEVLGIAAHDLKNPLSAIWGSIQMIDELIETEEFASKPEVTELANMINIGAEHTFNLINNLLDVNTIESGKIRFNLENVDIFPVLNRVVVEYTQKAKRKDITVHFTPTRREYVAYVDSSLVQQVLDNLVSNAVKYSPFDKNVYIRIFTTENATICCEVEDEGPGLSHEEQAQLFRKFSRLSPQPTNDESSSGLGLFIVKKWVNVMGGEVWCESELGHGAKFVVKFMPEK